MNKTINNTPAKDDCMRKRKSIEDIFTSLDPIYLSDFVAVKMMNGKYFICKNKITSAKGMVSEKKYKEALQASVAPIVLSDSYVYIDKELV